MKIILSFLCIAVAAIAMGFAFARINYFPEHGAGVGLHQAEPLSLVPEGYRRLFEDNTIVIDAAILPGEFEAVWVAYGETPDLGVETPEMSSELGMGTAGEYGSYGLIIPAADLQPGTAYFYRIFGRTVDGDVVQTGLNRFVSGK